MSPIASIPAAFAFQIATPSVPLVPDSAGQSASTMPRYLAGTGGFVFAVVAIVSVAGYFYHGRGTANNARKNGTWATFSSFLSSMRHRGSGTATTATGSDWHPDVECGLEQHVSMVYARFFHPTFWNLVECHPATSSAPAIYVEDEANEIPASEPKPYGMNSFLDMDDGDGDGDKNDGTKGTQENAGQGSKVRVAKAPPYDTSSVANVKFRSTIIGSTDRPGGTFLCVPGKHDDSSSDTSSCDEASQTLSDSERDVACSPYDGTVTESEIDRILTTPPWTPDSRMASELACLADSREFTCSPYDGILTTPPRPTGGSHGTTFDSALDSGSLYDGILTDSRLDISHRPCDEVLTTPTRSFPSSRRYGMADMADLAQTLKHTIPEEGLGQGLVRTVGRRSGLCNLTDFDETNSEADSATSYRHLERIKFQEARPTSSSCDVGVHDDRDGPRAGWDDGDTFTPSCEGPDLMRRILEELRDPNMDCTPRALSEDSNSEYSEDDIIDDDVGSVSQLTPTWTLDRRGRVSLEWTSSTPITDSDASDGGSIYPITPPPRSATFLSPPCVYKARMVPPATFWLNKEVQVAVPTYSVPHLWLPSRPFIRTHRPSRPLPMVCAPAWLPYLASEVV